MKNENIKRKKKIAAYSILLLFFAIAYVSADVMNAIKSANELLAYGDPMLVRLYTNIFIWLIILIIICIIATVLVVIILSANEK